MTSLARSLSSMLRMLLFLSRNCAARLWRLRML
nr:MAG TPA: hypothetical protein [Caudoviricetes sp.]